MQTEIVFAIELLALAAGANLVSRTGNVEKHARAFVKIAGYFIAIAAIATMLSTAYFEIQYVRGDYYESPLAE
jgi:hypothetical protein